MTRQAILAAFDASLSAEDIFVKATSQGGCDVHLSPFAERLFPFAVEVKGSEHLNIWKALAQATVNAKTKRMPPILFFKRAHTPLFVALTADDFLTAITRK